MTDTRTMWSARRNLLSEGDPDFDGYIPRLDKDWLACDLPPAVVCHFDEEEGTTSDSSTPTGPWAAEHEFFGTVVSLEDGVFTARLVDARDYERPAEYGDISLDEVLLGHRDLVAPGARFRMTVFAADGRVEFFFHRPPGLTERKLANAGELARRWAYLFDADEPG